MSQTEPKSFVEFYSSANGLKASLNLVVLARRTLVFVLTFTVASLLVASAACGGDSDEEEGDAIPTTATQAANGGGETTFDVTMADNSFDPSELTAPAGAAITINVTNGGTAIHNLRIAGEDGEFDTDDDAVSDPDMLSAGDTATVEWTGASEAGDYDFRCDFHPTEMTGAITIG